MVECNVEIMNRLLNPVFFIISDLASFFPEMSVKEKKIAHRPSRRNQRSLIAIRFLADTQDTSLSQDVTIHMTIYSATGDIATEFETKFIDRTCPSNRSHQNWPIILRGTEGNLGPNIFTRLPHPNVVYIDKYFIDSLLGRQDRFQRKKILNFRVQFSGVGQFRAKLDNM